MIQPVTGLLRERMCWLRPPPFFITQAAKAAPTMPAISLASADDFARPMELAEPSPRSRTLSRKALVPEATRVAVEATFDSMAVWLRPTRLSPPTLFGPIPRGIPLFFGDPRLRSFGDAPAFVHAPFPPAPSPLPPT